MSDAVWISREDRVEDGRVVPGPAGIHIEAQADDGIDPAARANWPPSCSRVRSWPSRAKNRWEAAS